MNIEEEIASLRRMTAGELRAKHAEVFGEPNRSGNKPYLIRRIAWRIQSQAEGGLSERAQARARELENDANLRINPPKSIPALTPDAIAPIPVPRPMPLEGTVLTRDYRGVRHQVKVLLKGYEYQGQIFGNLTAVTRVITGQHWSGNHFFGIRRAS